jgi:hypothetical protein
MRRSRATILRCCCNSSRARLRQPTKPRANIISRYAPTPASTLHRPTNILLDDSQVHPLNAQDPQFDLAGEYQPQMRNGERGHSCAGCDRRPAPTPWPADISPAFDAFKSRVQALYVCADALVNANSIRINTLALGAHLPTMYSTRSPFVDGGGLMAYGSNNAGGFRRAGD